MQAQVQALARLIDQPEAEAAAVIRMLVEQLEQVVGQPLPAVAVEDERRYQVIGPGEYLALGVASQRQQAQQQKQETLAHDAARQQQI
ncbi:hypothetical protein D9M70_649880 [compost metagenome]